MVSVDALTSWWERMTEERRTELLAHRQSPLRPDLALELWQDSGWIPVVQPGRWSAEVHRLVWRFAPEVEEFLASHAGHHDPGDPPVPGTDGSTPGLTDMLVSRPTG